MADGFKYEIDDKEFADALVKALDIAGDVQPLLEDIGDRIIFNTRRRFAEGVGPDGERWEPLSEITKQLRREGPGSGSDKPLNDTRALFRSIQKAVTGNTVSVGSNLPYAALQQFGGTIRPKNGDFLVFGTGENTVFAKESKVPARPYLGLNQDDRLDIIDVVNRHLREALGG